MKRIYISLFFIALGMFLFWMLFFSSGTKFLVNTYYGREFFKREIYRDVEKLKMQARQYGNLVPVQSMPFSGIYDTVFNFENEECYSSCKFVFAKDPKAQIFWQEKKVVGTNVNWTGRAFRSFFRNKELIHEAIDGSDRRFGILCKTKMASLSFIGPFDIPIIYNFCYNASEEKSKEFGNILYSAVNFDRSQVIFFNWRSLSPSVNPEPVAIFYWFELS